ncbi:hypothetical protein Lepto7375DRAFT_1607 [Leptolyngbya sp. PCC 7375]|nr:hypothetical protein Lepto7375DRAFT_1607 [Leptolyngbya sp. PCC 7375]
MMAGIATGLLATVLITGGFSAQSVVGWAKPANSSQTTSVAFVIDDAIAQAQTQQRQGQWPDAIATYKTILSNSESTALQQAQAAYQIGRLHRQLRQFVNAIPYLEQAQTQYQAADNPLGEAETLTELAYVYLLFERETLASETLEQAKQLFQPLSDGSSIFKQSLQADISRTEAIIQFRLEQYAAARALAKIAIVNYQQLVDNPDPDSPVEAILQNQLQVVLQTRNVGLVDFVNNDFDSAITILTEVIEGLETIYAEYQRLGNTTGIATTQHYLCETYSFVGASQPALGYCQEALATFQSLNYGHWTGQMLQSIGSIYYFAEPNDVGLQTEAEAQQQSRRFQEQAIAAMAAVGDAWKVAEYQLSLGENYFFVGDYDRAFELENQALATYEDLLETPYGEILGAPYQVGQALLFRGDVFYQRGDYTTALEDYRRAEEIYAPLSQVPLATLEEKRSLGYAHLDLGRTYEKLARYGDAISSLEQALAIGRDFYEPFTESMALDGLANISLELGESAQQETLSAEAEEVRSQRREYRIGLFEAPEDNLANLSPEEQLAAAQEFGSQQQEGYAYTSIGLEAYYNNDYENALVAFHQAIAIHQKVGDIPAVASSWSMVGLSYEGLGQLEAATLAFQKSLALHRQTGDRFQARVTLRDLAYVYFQRNQPEIAIAFYKEAVTVSEVLRDELETLPLARQASYVQSVEATYRFLADLLLQQGRILEAQQVLELLKVQEIRNYIDDQRAVNSASGVTLLPQEESLLISHGSLVEFGKTVSQCEQSRCDQLSKLRNQRDDLARAYQDNVDKLSSFIREQLAADQALLDPEDLGGQAREILKQQPGTVVIYPLVLEDKLWLLWATEGRVVSRREIAVSRSEVANAVVQMRQLLDNPRSDIDTLQATGQQLYQWLVQPIEEELEAGSITNLVFALDRNLRYVPMAVLHDGEQYLVEKYGISHILSEELTDWRDRFPADISVLAAGVSAGTAEFNPLPYVPLELDGIVREDGEDTNGIYDGTSLLDEAFTFNSLRDGLTGQNILHIATHGEFVPGRSDESYLLLGDGERLPIPEIRILGDYLEDVHLAVLSACETGLGGAKADGLEIQGMSYFFLDHGVESVLVSLWRVSDVSTSLLMQQFYRNLATGELSKTEALRQAQLMWIGSGEELVEDTARIIGQRVAEEQGSTLLSHPYYWAPFILIGNGL